MAGGGLVERLQRLRPQQIELVCFHAPVYERLVRAAETESVVSP